ncbi:MAG: tRNA (N6-threonylcarbamoyladenosine(37)-N6)-methyltransferase TrmO [Bacteroidales bacterium]|nr:tRNA (N6-threonylcarbamoyladenosine(37)-N6)-methyltransferase TrmO [Bacteroidales bacterium]
MEKDLTLEPVAYYRGSFGSKFGIPRQSSLAGSLSGKIVFTPKYRAPEALRGLEGFSHIWLIWGFSANREAKGEWQPTVRPPRLGGNTAVGVWATRSPYRPNPIGLSCVEIEAISGNEILVKGADLMDGTPIYDIKPYIRYADSHPEAVSGFASDAPERALEVIIPENLPLNESQRKALEEVLGLDPRPAYQDDPEREYAFPFEGKDVRFKVQGGVLTVTGYGTLRA